MVTTGESKCSCTYKHNGKNRVMVELVLVFRVKNYLLEGSVCMVKWKGMLCRAYHTDFDGVSGVSIRDYMLLYEGWEVGVKIYK